MIARIGSCFRFPMRQAKSQYLHRLFTCLATVRHYMGASSSHEMDPPAIVQPLKEHTATLIFLHGLGDRGTGWATGLASLKLQHIKCVCPHAPIRPVTLNAGMRMPSWFDIIGLDSSSPQDVEGIKEASEMLQGLIENEVKIGIPRNRIFIGGFSQGGAVALYTAFAVNKPIGGVIALSTWMPLHRTLAKRTGSSCLCCRTKTKYLLVFKEPKYNRDVPVLQCHGTLDPLVRFSWGQETSTFIRSFNPNLTFKAYDNMMHSSCPEEMQDVKVFPGEAFRILMPVPPANRQMDIVKCQILHWFFHSFNSQRRTSPLSVYLVALQSGMCASMITSP
ncbi:acyl-protein thioesterase 1-like isoform X3 [Pomacea canaliculata]|uniref:acyl-protein thioesterase 1-like isoform X3 n=1 Tax=Pomacea canaliculata TaxID=400727 RepID=UPI000D730D06|nr:acyl-protein thioesterase 1-like isoform X3 [Pomacea canaliculata]